MNVRAYGMLLKTILKNLFGDTEIDIETKESIPLLLLFSNASNSKDEPGFDQELGAYHVCHMGGGGKDPPPRIYIIRTQGRYQTYVLRYGREES